ETPHAADEWMNVLKTVEREVFDSPPMFNGVERKHYFDFPIGLRRLAGNLRTPIHRLGFLLSAGYFKAAKRFFPPRTFHQRDIEYVSRQVELTDLLPATALASANSTKSRSEGSTVSGSSTPRHPTSCSKRSPAWCTPKSNPRSSSGAASIS